MGMDVNLYVEADPNLERLVEAEAYFRAHSTMGDSSSFGEPHVLVAVPDLFDRPRVEVQTLDRYYDEFYPRGYWPRILEGIRVLQHLFPDGRVFYGSDTTDEGEEVTEELLDRLSAHWDSTENPAS